MCRAFTGIARSATGVPLGMKGIRGTALAIALTLCAAAAAALPHREAAMPSLAAVYRPFFPIGAAVEPHDLTAVGDLLASQAGSLVAENVMKWERIHPRSGNDASSFNFT